MGFIMSRPPADLIIPRDKTLVVGADLWSGVRSGCWTFNGGGANEFIPDIARGNGYGLVPFNAATKFSGKLGSGMNVGSSAGTGDIWEYGIDQGAEYYEPTNFLRPTASVIDAQGFYIEILAELLAAPTDQAGIWTNARKTSGSYEGIDISMNSGTNAIFVNFGDSDGTSSANRRSALSNTGADLNEPFLFQFAADDNFTQTNWHLGVNGIYGNSVSGSAGDIPEYDTITSTTMHCMIGGRNRPFVNTNFPGVIYGYNIIYRDFSEAMMLDRYRRFWEMFTLARTREAFPTGFNLFAGLGPGPQAQSLT